MASEHPSGIRRPAFRLASRWKAGLFVETAGSVSSVEWNNREFFIGGRYVIRYFFVNLHSPKRYAYERGTEAVYHL